MESTKKSSKKLIIIGWILSGLAILFLVFDGVGKLVKPAPVLQATRNLGYPESTLTGIGLLLLICTILYAIPRFSILGAVLLTGYFGGAIASNVRLEYPLFSHILFPVYVAVFIWGGLYLRQPQLKRFWLGAWGKESS